MAPPHRPVDDVDFWSDEVILDPYTHYDRLRDRGPVVWLSRHDAWAITHYSAVRDALLLSDVFSSASGCMMNAATANAIMLCTDDPDHLALRRLFAKPLMPKALTELKPRLQSMADAKIDELERFVIMLVHIRHVEGNFGIQRVGRDRRVGRCGPIGRHGIARRPFARGA